MKKLFQKIISVLLVFALMNLQGFASVGVSLSDYVSGDASEFADFSEDAFCDEFSDLELLESFLEVNDATYSDLQNEGSNLILNVSAEPSLPFSDDVEGSGPALGIPSFLWGCVFGWVGLLIVYLVTENKAETKKALWGCIASSVVGIIIYVVVIAAAASTATVSTNTYSY